MGQRGALVSSSIPFLALAIPMKRGSSRFLMRGVAHWAFAGISTPVGSLMDPLARAACAQDADLWGKARIYGAVGWGLMHLVLGPVLDQVGFGALFVSNIIMRAFYFVASRTGVPEACSEVR